MAISIDTKIEKINGKVNVLDTKIDDITKSLEELKNAVKGQNNVSQAVFNKYIDDTKDAIEWVENRIAIEKFIIGTVGLIGVTQIITTVLIVMKYVA